MNLKLLLVNKEIKRLCKLRDCAKAMEKAAGLKMGEMGMILSFLTIVKEKVKKFG